MIETLKVGDQEFNFAELMESARVVNDSADYLALSAEQIDTMEGLLDEAMDGASYGNESTAEGAFVETASLAGGEDPWVADDIA